MNTRAFSLALIISVLAMFMVYTYIEDQENQIKLKFGTEKTVVVAKEDIKELTILDDSKLTVISVPQNFLAPGSFSNIKDLENTIATVPILAGEQITKPRVTYPGPKTGLSRQVASGKRAFSFNVSEKQSVANLVKPGDRVDIILVMNLTNVKLDSTTHTVFQDILVLATGLNVSNNIPLVGIRTSDEVRTLNLNVHQNYNTVTVELSPYEIQKAIHFTEGLGSNVYLSLRNNTDKENINIRKSTTKDLIEDSLSLSPVKGN
jgi:pilus assembly protein CpaB